MANIMISVDDEKELEIRKYAQEVFGGKKGSLSDFIWAAVAEYISNMKKGHERNAAIKRMLERMNSARKLGILNKDGKAYLTRDEMYGERIAKIHRH